MSDKNASNATIAMRLAAACRSAICSDLNSHDKRQHPEVKFIYFPYISKELNALAGKLGTYKENSGHNSEENMKWLMKVFYPFFKKSNVSETNFPDYYLKCKLQVLKKTFGTLTYDSEIIYSDYGQPNWQEINDELVSLLAPINIKNDTKFILVKDFAGKLRIGHDDYDRLRYEDIEYFELWFRGKDIQDYKMVYVPPFGYRFIRKDCIFTDRPFLLSAEDRRFLILLLTQRDDNLFVKYVNIFKLKPIEAEYELWLYYNNRDHLVGVRQWFDHEIYCLEHPVEDENHE